MRAAASILFLAAALPRPAFSAELNVILVVMDTVRADDCSLYGSARKTTPLLDQLAAKGLTFETALAQSDWTIPAHASLFTGRRPLTHGVLRPGDRLGDGETTLAQLFKKKGFRTAAFAGAFLKPDVNGLARGFDEVQVFDRGPIPNEPGLMMGSLDRSVPAAVSWLEANSKKGFFLFVHGGDAHSPYVCPEPWRDRFATQSSSAAGNAGFIFKAGLNPLEDWRRFSAADLIKAKALRSEGPGPAERLREVYDGCLSYGDEQLAALTDAMTRLGLWDKTVLIVTSDHGDEFADHGGLGHFERPLHQEIAHVPLVILDPEARRAAGRRTPVHFEEIDLLPTVADIEGWPVAADVEGRSKKAVLEAAGDAPKERVQFSQAAASGMENNGTVDMEALRLGRWKALRMGSRWELFDLNADPGERANLFDSRPDVFLELAGDRLALEPR